jgi:hypothetical protein
MIALRSDADHMQCNAHSLLPVAQIGEMELSRTAFAHARRLLDRGAALGMRRDFAPF